MADKTEIFDPVFLSLGVHIYNYDYVDKLRSDKKERKNIIAPMNGSQEKMLCSNAKIIFYVGLRGVGKSATLFQKTYKQIENPSFRVAVFRKQKGDSDDAGSIVDASKKFFRLFGKYNKAQHDMSWYFDSGSSLMFAHYSDSYKDFVDRFRGKEIHLIEIDEVTQIPFEHFRFLPSCNRSSEKIECQIVGTCNPDGDSWVFRFVSGVYTPVKGEASKPKWIDKDGFPVPEMDGKILYFFLYGERADQAYWGETKEEVYEQAKSYIDPIAKAQDANPLEFITSCTLITGFTKENTLLIDKDDQSYYGSLAMLPPEERERDLEGRWAPKRETTTLISLRNLDDVFDNVPQTDKYRCVTADISSTGFDNTILYYWEGFHMVDAICFKATGAETLKVQIRQFLDKYGVSDRDFCFDATGDGSLREHFPDAMQYIANSKAFDTREIEIGKIKQKVSSYENVRGQVIDLFAKRIKAKGYSIDENLVYAKMDGKMLADHFKEEYIIIAKDPNRYDGKFKAIDKKDVMFRIGHSPDFMDAWYIREYVELCRDNNKRVIHRSGAWML